MTGATLHDRQTVDGHSESTIPDERRGPMRPERLTPARRRLDGSMIAKIFAGIDGLLLAAATAPTNLEGAAGGMASIGYVLLSVILLTAAGAYGFRRREPLAQHMGRVGAALTGAGLVIAAGLSLEHAPALLMGQVWRELGLSLGALAAAHGLWLALLAHWRRGGRLAQNLVVVGANKNAERLIAHAMASGEVAVLGVFDDRSGRAPRAIGGVPVLGDTSALLGHRIMPYVDRVVITTRST